jgi:plastocyanin
MAKIQFLPLALRALLALGALSQAVAAGEGETVVVITTKHRFEPAEVTVKVGTTVRWENREKVQFHNVTFPDQGDDPSDYFFPGETRERTFDKPGTYPYTCEPHDASHQMRGVVHVVE